MQCLIVYPLHGDSPDQPSAGPNAGAKDDEEEYAEFTPDQVEEKPVPEPDREAEPDIDPLPNTSSPASTRSTAAPASSCVVNPRLSQ